MAASMLYQHRLDNLGKAFAMRNVHPVVVKGQSIADMAYPPEQLRLSADVDILAGDDDKTIVQVLLELGYRQQPRHSRFFPFEEKVFHHHDLTLPPVVEVHQLLDKILLRPIPYAEIIARSRSSGRTGIRYPTIEDLVLLVVLHASSDPYFDAVRVERDLRYLLACNGLDMELVQQRARQWQLSRALKRLLAKQYPRNGSHNAEARLGNAYRFFATQLGWHDSAATVCRGLLYYAWARLCDRLVFWRMQQAA